MKKLLTIFLITLFSTPLFAMGPIEDDVVDNSTSNYSSSSSQLEASSGDTSATSSDSKGGFLSKVGKGWNNVKDALGLSDNDISNRKKAREEKKVAREEAKNQATGKEKVLLSDASIVGDNFDNKVDGILKSTDNIDPSAELDKAEEIYRSDIDGLTADKSGKTVDAIKQDMEASIKEARNLINKNPDKLKEFRNSASSANRTNMADKAITSVSTAAMGLGAMQLAQGLSEQKADKEAASDMQGYLSGLYCTYSNKQAKYGVKGIKIDDENKLDLLREEFLNKAAQLKYTKEQLGLKAGLESEVVFDDKATALYETQGTKRAASKFGRLSEALMDESGTDAQMLADQQEKSKNRVTGGTIAVVGGAAVAIGGGALINKFGNKGSTANVVKDVVQTNETSDAPENINSQEDLNSSQTEIKTEESSGEMGPPTEEEYLLNNKKIDFKTNVASFK